MKKRKPKIPVLIGRREYVNFPALGITGIEAKIDTGAYTSSIHCHAIIEKQVNKKKFLCFKVLDYEDIEFFFEKYEFQKELIFYNLLLIIQEWD